MNINDIKVKDDKVFYKEEELSKEKWKDIDRSFMPSHVIFSTNDSPRFRLSSLILTYAYSKLCGLPLHIHKVENDGFDAYANKLYDAFSLRDDIEFINAKDLTYPQSRLNKNGSWLYYPTKSGSEVLVMTSNMKPTYELELLAILEHYKNSVFLLDKISVIPYSHMVSDHDSKMFTFSCYQASNDDLHNINTGLRVIYNSLYDITIPEIADLTTDDDYFDDELLDVLHMKAINECNFNYLLSKLTTASEKDAKIIMKKLGFE